MSRINIYGMWYVEYCILRKENENIMKICDACEKCLRKFKMNLMDYIFKNIIYFFTNCAKENYRKEFRRNKTWQIMERNYTIMDRIKIYIIQI